MIIDPRHVQELYEQFRNETQCYWARDDDLAVNLAPVNNKLYSWLSARQGLESNPFVATIRTFRIHSETTEHLIVPYYLYRCLCEHLNCFAWDDWSPIEINYAPDNGFDVGLGSHGEILSLKCRSWEKQWFREEIVRTIEDIRLPQNQSFIMRKSVVQSLGASLAEWGAGTNVVFCHSRSLLIFGDSSPYFLVFVGSNQKFHSSFKFDFPYYKMWFACGAIKFTVTNERLLLETSEVSHLVLNKEGLFQQTFTDEEFSALSPLKLITADPLTSSNLDSEPVGTWTISNPDALLACPTDWEYASFLFTEEQVLVQPEGKVGADLTTFGYYRGAESGLRLNMHQFLNLIQKGFHRFDIRSDDPGNLYLAGHLQVHDDTGRLFSGEKRKRNEEIIALVSTFRGSVEKFRIFPEQMDGTVQ